MSLNPLQVAVIIRGEYIFKRRLNAYSNHKLLTFKTISLIYGTFSKTMSLTFYVIYGIILKVQDLVG